MFYTVGQAILPMPILGALRIVEEESETRYLQDTGNKISLIKRREVGLFLIGLFLS